MKTPTDDAKPGGWRLQLLSSMSAPAQALLVRGEPPTCGGDRTGRCSTTCCGGT